MVELALVVVFAELLGQVPCVRIYMGIKRQAVQPRLGRAALPSLPPLVFLITDSPTCLVTGTFLQPSSIRQHPNMYRFSANMYMEGAFLRLQTPALLRAMRQPPFAVSPSSFLLFMMSATD
jgi:hypothetical protein